MALTPKTKTVKYTWVGRGGNVEYQIFFVNDKFDRVEFKSPRTYYERYMWADFAEVNEKLLEIEREILTKL